MEHIEEAGIHSGDSSCVVRLRSSTIVTWPRFAIARRRIAKALKVIGLMNSAYA